MAGRSMGRGASSVGRMDGAFFVSRTELLTWVNGVLGMNLEKVEQCASGAVYCAILDACHPQQVATQKLNWMAKVDHEFIPNYRVLQSAFDRLNIERHIAVDQLICAKFQDNLEFLQWMKCYWEREGQAGVAADYDPVGRRAGKPAPPWACAPADISGVGEKENLRPQRSTPAEQKRPASGATARRTPVVTAPVPTTRPQSGRAAPSARQAQSLTQASATVASLTNMLQEQKEEIEELQYTNGGLEKERNYYFKRLRNVEILCTTLQAQMDPGLTADKLVQHVLDIMCMEDAEEQEDLATGTAEGGVVDVAGQSLGVGDRGRPGMSEHF